MVEDPPADVHEGVCAGGSELRGEVNGVGSPAWEAGLLLVLEGLARLALPSERAFVCPSGGKRCHQPVLSRSGAEGE
ncbi:MAG: hypothetical protein K6T17_08710 [Fimbriimonadales bacterium]|nr:hypothetical protein [Fimbriimonadales bacterium]